MIDIADMSVLIADDKENMYTSIRSIMRLLKFGRKFTYAPSGDAALKILQETPFDLALLDNSMPGITGLELLGIIRNDKKLCDLPVIMITGQAEHEFITHAAESDIDAYLLKPITINLLKQKVPQVIDKANNPSPMTLCLKQAARLDDEGDIEGAIREARMAMEHNPQSTRPLRELGYYCLKKGELAQAEEYLSRAVQRNRIDVIAWNHLGDLHLQQEDFDQALKCFSRAMSISPRHYQRGLNLGKLLVRKKLYDKAMPVFNKVFDLAKDPLAVKEEIAGYCIEHGAGALAARLLKNIVDQQPGRSDLLSTLGMLCGDTEEALGYLSRAEKLEPGNLELKLRMARIYLAQGKVIRAETPLKAILKVDPEHAEARKLLRQCV
jgi:CheY-like chemotaxis protein